MIKFKVISTNPQEYKLQRIHRNRNNNNHYNQYQYFKRKKVSYKKNMSFSDFYTDFIEEYHPITQEKCIKLSNNKKSIYFICNWFQKERLKITYKKHWFQKERNIKWFIISLIGAFGAFSSLIALFK